MWQATVCVGRVGISYTLNLSTMNLQSKAHSRREGYVAFAPPCYFRLNPKHFSRQMGTTVKRLESALFDLLSPTPKTNPRQVGLPGGIP